MSWLKRRLPAKRWKRICIYLLSIFVILLAADMVLVQMWRHVDISYDTTRITSPLNADGMPDYIAARNAEASQGVIAENNAATDLLRIVGTDTFPESWRKRVLPEIGLSSESIPSKVVTYKSWRESHQPVTTNGSTAGNTTNDDPLKAPWKTADYPDRAAWIKSQDETLASLHRALEKQRFYIPWATSTGSVLTGDTISVLLSQIGKLRACEYLLYSDAMRAIGENDFATFDRDFTDTLKLSQLMTEGSTIIEYLSGCASANDAAHMAQLVATTPRFLNPNEALTLQRQLEGATPFPDVSRALDQGERFFLLDSFCYASVFGFDRLLARVTRSADGAGPPEHPIARVFVPVHFNSSLRDGNRSYDEIVAAMRLPNYQQRKEAFQKLEDRAHHIYFSIADALVAEVIPSFNRTVQYHEEVRIQRDLAVLALALNRYHAAHSEYPPLLADLKPGLVAELPQDTFANAAFHYRREDKGYVLYSVGPNGKDDGGVDRRESTGGNYDLAVKSSE